MEGGERGDQAAAFVWSEEKYVELPPEEAFKGILSFLRERPSIRISKVEEPSLVEFVDGSWKKEFPIIFSISLKARDKGTFIRFTIDMARAALVVILLGVLLALGAAFIWPGSTEGLWMGATWGLIFILGCALDMVRRARSIEDGMMIFLKGYASRRQGGQPSTFPPATRASY